MVFLRNKRPPVKPEPAPTYQPIHDPWAWLPEYAHRPAPHDDERLLRPYPQDAEAQHARVRVDALNAILINRGFHATQLDGGFEFTFTSKQTDELAAYSLELSQTVQGLGFHVRVASFNYDGLIVTGTGDIAPRYETYDTTTLETDEDSIELFMLEDFEDFDAALTDLVARITPELTRFRVRVTPATIVAWVLLTAFKPVWLNRRTATGGIMPAGGVSQLYCEYLRAGMPVSYLFAAFLPAYRLDAADEDWDDEPWTPSLDEDPVPRFTITDVFALREQPISLVLEMVGASRASIIANAESY